LNRQTSLFVGSHRVQQPFFWPTQPHSNLSVDYSLCCVHDFIQPVDFPCFVLVMICAKEPGRTRVCLCLGRRLLVCIHAHTSTRPSMCDTPSTPSRTVPVCVLPEGMWDWSLASILSSVGRLGPDPAPEPRGCEPPSTPSRAVSVCVLPMGNGDWGWLGVAGWLGDGI
jgi:hypothetical protein